MLLFPLSSWSARRKGTGCKNGDAARMGATSDGPGTGDDGIITGPFAVLRISRTCAKRVEAPSAEADAFGSLRLNGISTKGSRALTTVQ